jgi:molybdopterin molybdotransferase
MKEYVQPRGAAVAVAAKVGEGDHIRRVGEEYRRGDGILPAGLKVTPPVVGMIATLGLDRAAVRRLPTALVITMGDELVAPGAKAGTGQIPDSNGPAVCAALKAMGLAKVRHKRVRDRLPALVKAMKDGLERDDLVVTVGGASVGDYDFVHEARRELKVRDLFSRIAIKPGKPNLFGVHRGRVPVFGLPGNPVSALVSLHMLVRPAIERMAGAVAPSGLVVPVRLDKAVKQAPGRLAWLRGSLALEGGALKAELATGQGSHMLSGLALADVLVEIPAETGGVKPGETVWARVLDWS